MKDTLVTLFFICFLIILMPRRRSKIQKKTRKKRRSKKKSKRIGNFNNFQQKNVYDEPLQVCSTNPLTGYHRSGYCFTDDMDEGTHTVCARVDDKFLDYTKSKGNDLSTPSNIFPGLKQGDNWCLCALRWNQALDAGKAPPINLNATNKKTLEYIDLDTLENYKI